MRWTTISRRPARDGGRPPRRPSARGVAGALGGRCRRSAPSSPRLRPHFRTRRARARARPPPRPARRTRAEAGLGLGQLRRLAAAACGGGPLEPLGCDLVGRGLGGLAPPRSRLRPSRRGRRPDAGTADPQREPDRLLLADDDAAPGLVGEVGVERGGVQRLARACERRVAAGAGARRDPRRRAHERVERLRLGRDRRAQVGRGGTGQLHLAQPRPGVQQRRRADPARRGRAGSRPRRPRSACAAPRPRRPRRGGPRRAAPSRPRRGRRRTPPGRRRRAGRSRRRAQRCPCVGGIDADGSSPGGRSCGHGEARQGPLVDGPPGPQPEGRPPTAARSAATAARDDRPHADRARGRRRPPPARAHRVRAGRPRTRAGCRCATSGSRPSRGRRRAWRRMLRPPAMKFAQSAGRLSSTTAAPMPADTHREESGCPARSCTSRSPPTTPAQAREFWGSLFGWQFESFPGPVGVPHDPISEQTGGAITNMEPGKRGTRAYFSVDDINAGAARVNELGGTASDAMPVPRDGLVRDLHRPARQRVRPLADRRVGPDADLLAPAQSGTVAARVQSTDAWKIWQQIHAFGGCGPAQRHGLSQV